EPALVAFRRAERSADRAFHDRPAVVATGLDPVDLLPVGFSNVPDPDLSRLAIHGEAPRITEAIGPDLLAPPLRVPDVRVVRGNAVIEAARGVIHVEAEDLPEQLRSVLRVAHGIERDTAIAEGDIEVSVGSEGDVASVVVVGVARRLDREQDHLALRVRLKRVIRRALETG